MTPYAARRLFDELTNAEIAYRLDGISVAEFCRRRSHRHLGEVRRELLRVSYLGADANRFMNFFLAEFDEHENPTPTIED